MSFPMESAPVNWEALDALAIDFAKSERLVDDDECSSSSYRWRLLIRQTRRSIELGDIDSAIRLLQEHQPSVLDDHRLLFRLQKQKFIELLRRGTNEDRDSAIQCARTSLAPCALDAYPEAYEEFKHVLLALIYKKDDQTSPVVNEWSERRRFEIAGLLSSVLRAHLRAYDPIFSMTLRYLIGVHKGYCLRQGISSPIADLTNRLLFEDRDPPATPQESMYEAPSFDEVDIQALAHAVELTRQGAVESLKFAKGDRDEAFQNELCRMRLDVSLLDELVREYFVYRGIVDPVSSTPVEDSQATSGITTADQLDAAVSSSGNCSVGSDSDMSISNMHTEGCKTDVLSSKNADMDIRSPSDAIINLNEDCSTSGMFQPEGSKITQLARSRRATNERGKRKRWRSRDDSFDTFSESIVRNWKHELSESLDATNADCKKSLLIEKYEVVLGVKELASRGMAEEVVGEINSLFPEFFAQNPVLLFQLKQVEFLKLVGLGEYSRALEVASCHLGPLAAKDQALVKPLKETLFALLRPQEEAIVKHVPLDALSTSLQVAVGRRLGIEEPQLMKIIRATLQSHTEWFKIQMCKDQFEDLLWINSLKHVGGPLLGNSDARRPNSNADASTQGSSQAKTTTTSDGDGSSPNQISSSGDVHCDENAILKVMEFLALPRADAIHLLAQYNGNAETVIQQIFA